MNHLIEAIANDLIGRPAEFKSSPTEVREDQPFTKKEKQLSVEFYGSIGWFLWG